MAALTTVHALTRMAVVLFAGLAVLIALDGLVLAALYAATALVGVLELLSDGAAVAVLPRAVSARDLDRANARIAGAQTALDGFAGPPLGGLLFGWAAAPLVTAALGYRAVGGDHRPEPVQRP
ncbi:hypothetical protein [Nocardiopsis changdeensis]|uniref:hypothetical protein n=1 Tax=Nocardiopsis changdeensis TaxID=2831969 RepID=UPI003F472355